MPGDSEKLKMHPWMEARRRGGTHRVSRVQHAPYDVLKRRFATRAKDKSSPSEGGDQRCARIRKHGRLITPSILALECTL